MTTRLFLSLLGLTTAMTVMVRAQDKPAVQPSPAPAQAEWNFDKNEVGKLAIGWRVGQTGGTSAVGRWTVIKEEGAASGPNVLKLETQAESGIFNLCIAEKPTFKDLDISVRLKANSGNEDQGGGPIWRCKDENNYYICRINPLEENFRVYKVENGKRSQLKSEKIETKTGQWYEVRAVMVDDKIECYVDGKKYLEVTDATFKDAGMVGLWSKADASSSFDNVVVRASNLSKSDTAGAAKPGSEKNGRTDDDHDDDDDDREDDDPR